MVLASKFTLWLILFCVSSSCAILVNKYVLWTLAFTYPTIFQSWQMFVAAFSMISLHVFGFIELQLFSKSSLQTWLPAVCLFTISIYSGSIALAKLPVPVFCLIQQTMILCLMELSNMYKGLNKTICEGLTIIGSVFCVLMTMHLDVEYDIDKYKWIIVHCLCNGCYSYYALYVSSHLQIK